MQLSWIWKTILIFFVGKLILRIGGRKSISQITITQTIVMIGIGSLLIQPVSQKGLLITFLVAVLLIVLMIITEYLEVKFDIFETIFSGKAIMVVENGKPLIKNLRKIRMSIDRLETRLRQSGISSIEDVEYASIEVSGQIGYKLKDSKQPLTKEDFTTLINEISSLKKLIISDKKTYKSKNDIFKEIKNNKYEGDNKEP